MAADFINYLVYILGSRLATINPLSDFCFDKTLLLMGNASFHVWYIQSFARSLIILWMSKSENVLFRFTALSVFALGAKQIDQFEI